MDYFNWFLLLMAAAFLGVFASASVWICTKLHRISNLLEDLQFEIESINNREKFRATILLTERIKQLKGEKK